MAITLAPVTLVNTINSNTKFSEFGSKIQETITDFGNKMNTNLTTIQDVLDSSTQYTKAQEDSMLAERDATATKNLNVLSQAKADGISGFVDRELDLEISETNAIVGIKNRYAKFGNEIVDLYDANGNYKSIDLAPTVPDVQTIGSTPLTVTDATITDTDVAVDAVVGTDATIPAHNNGHQTKITARVNGTTNGMEVQILDKSNSNAVIRAQVLDSHESDKTLEFWVPANADGYYVHCIKRVNAGSGDESIIVTAKGYEDLVTTDVVNKGDYAVIDKEELVTNGTFDVVPDGQVGHDNGDGTVDGYNNNRTSNSIVNNKLKVTMSDDSYSYAQTPLVVSKFIPGVNYIITYSIDIGTITTGVYVYMPSSLRKGLITSSGTYSYLFTYNENDNIRLQIEIISNKDEYILIDNISVTPVDDIMRATEDIPAGTSVYDSRFQVRDYVSNQNLVTLKQDASGTVTTYTETLFDDATEEDCNLDRDNVMLKNGFSMSEDGLFHKQNDKHIIVGLYQC